MHIMRTNVIFARAVLLLSLATFSSVTVAATTVVNVLLEDSSSDTDKADATGMREAQQQLGHKSVKTTEIYLRARAGEKVTPTK
jgi:hypothetical protein